MGRTGGPSALSTLSERSRGSMLALIVLPEISVSKPRLNSPLLIYRSKVLMNVATFSDVAAAPRPTVNAISLPIARPLNICASNQGSKNSCRTRLWSSASPAKPNAWTNSSNQTGLNNLSQIPDRVFFAGQQHRSSLYPHILALLETGRPAANGWVSKLGRGCETGVEMTEILHVA